ncbi:GNAT family N-acetyltransferase [Cupriavidus necator]|uniref:GNAT family N-acetyltransferase n=2 Tax=Cupriavidus necator TaxID=106590 RepID=A0A367PF42_CUPNE|nr:GNAT family N-acetyltransferase [Cupriavidus necator]QQX87586.1 GNAT family N-acetyltransferase [Cupriavidus necator]RCJ05837.1 GNAT family N-acetyltransferase [Cupriavidus necator]
MIKDMRIRAAEPADMQAVSQVLHSCGLPISDMDHLSRLFSLAVLGEKVIGCACGEIYGETVIIQSVAVLAECRGHQVATHLVGAILMRARAHGCTKAAVLTSEYPAFFARFGFTLTAVGEMPQEMQLSKEFVRRFGARTHCMCRRLD